MYVKTYRLLEYYVQHMKKINYSLCRPLTKQKSIKVKMVKTKKTEKQKANSGKVFRAKWFKINNNNNNNENTWIMMNTHTHASGYTQLFFECQIGCQQS